MKNKSLLKKSVLYLSVICLFTCFFTSTCFAAPRLDSVETEKPQYTVESLTYEEYVVQLTEMVGAQKANETLAQLAQRNSIMSTNSTVYKKYTETKPYIHNVNYQANIVGFFVLEGYGNYYDIISADVSSQMSSGSSYATWLHTISQVKSLSASQAKIYSEGKFSVPISASKEIQKVSYSGNTYLISESHGMNSTVTVEMLKTCPSY